MTLAFVVGIVGYLAGMLHGKRLSAQRRERTYESWYAQQQVLDKCLSWKTLHAIDPNIDPFILVSTQYNAHPPCS